MSGEERQRQRDVAAVMVEREALVKACQDYITLIDGDTSDRIDVEKVVLRVSQHLGNIAGFCDRRTRLAIFQFQRLLAVAMIDPTGPYSTTFVKGCLPFVIGITVDYQKRPFKMVGLSFEALNTKVKAILKK